MAQSTWRTFARLKRDKAALFGVSIIVLYAVIAALAPILATADPLEQDLNVVLSPPGGKYPLGTDKFGRDIYSRLVWGARVSLFAAVVPVAIGLSFGLTLGLASGYRGGLLDEIVMRAMDFLLSIPYFLLALIFIAALGPGLVNAMLAVGIGLIPSYTRIIRGSVMVVKEQLYIKAAKAIGVSAYRSVFRHVLPNVMTPIIVFTSLRLADALLTTAALSFVGLGAQPPTPEWGLMLNAARELIFAAPHAVFFPALAITLVVLGFNLLGDAIRDLLDPRYRT